MKTKQFGLNWVIVVSVYDPVYSQINNNNSNIIFHCIVRERERTKN